MGIVKDVEKHDVAGELNIAIAAMHYTPTVLSKHFSPFIIVHESKVPGSEHEFPKSTNAKQGENPKNILQNTRITHGLLLEKQYGMLKEKNMLQNSCMQEFKQKLIRTEKKKNELEKELKSTHLKLCVVQAKSDLGATPLHVKKDVQDMVESKQNQFF